MAMQATTEQRLEAVERAVQELQRLVGSRVPAKNWLEQFAGSMDDYPEFESVVKYGREFRETDRPKEEDPT